MLYGDCFFCYDHDLFGFVIIDAIRFFTCACEWLVDIMFALVCSSYVFMFVSALVLKLLNPFFLLGD